MRLVDTTKSLLKQWDWVLFGLIFLYMALPRFYHSYSIYLIGNTIPDTNALATVAQWQFIDLLLEVVQETFVLAIFFFVGRGIQRDEGPGPSIRTALTSILLFSGILAVVLFFLSDNFVSVIGTPESIRETTSQFLKIKTATIPLFLLSMAAVVIVETVNIKRYILTIAVLQVVYQFIFDSLFYGGYAFSLDLGVLGVAWSEIVSGSCLFITTLILLRRIIFEKVKNFLSFFTLKDWRIYFRVGGWSGFDSIVRNVAYFFMIVRLLNLLGESSIGGYYLAMHIIWSFLLVPILALAESTRVLIANHSQDIRKVRQLWYSALIIGGIIIVIWIILLPFWGNFAGLLNSNAEIVGFSLTAMGILIVPYILLALNLVTDSIFYGLGKTQYQAYQAIITNGTVYVIAFILYLTDVWTPTFTSILILFGIGILVDSVFTVYYAFRVLFFQQKGSDGRLSR
ncbi:MATE family efflux transporter [Chloroflexota bacterium]